MFCTVLQCDVGHCIEFEFAALIQQLSLLHWYWSKMQCGTLWQFSTVHSAFTALTHSLTDCIVSCTQHCSTLPAAVASLTALTDRSPDLLLLPLLMLCILLLLPLLVILLYTITTDHGPICLLLQPSHLLFGHLSLLVYFSCHCFFFEMQLLLCFAK